MKNLRAIKTFLKLSYKQKLYTPESLLSTDWTVVQGKLSRTQLHDALSRNDDDAECRSVCLHACLCWGTWRLGLGRRDSQRVGAVLPGRTGPGEKSATRSGQVGDRNAQTDIRYGLVTANAKSFYDHGSL